MAYSDSLIGYVSSTVTQPPAVTYADSNIGYVSNYVGQPPGAYVWVGSSFVPVVPYLYDGTTWTPYSAS